MKSIAAALAWKYLRFKDKDRNISFMMRVCFLGIFIGTFALMLTLIITNGFEKVIHEKMQGINAHIIMSSPHNRLDYQSIAEVLEKEFRQELCGISGSSVKQAIIDHNKVQNVLFLKGIDPINEPAVTNIAEKITLPLTANTEEKKEILSKLLTKGNIIIGHKTAENLKLKNGDKITIMIPEPTGKKSISLTKQKVTVAGIFNVGLEEYDNNFAFASIDFVNHVFDEEGVEQITLKLRPQHTNFLEKTKQVFFGLDHEQITINKLKKRFPEFNVYSWKELYPALVSSLKLEKYVMFFIIALITLVAAMNMISLLFMQIQQKRRDIAIYKAMGMPDNTIQAIFLRIGLMLTFIASAGGLASAALIGYLLERYPFIQLPDVYYVSHLPARLDLDIVMVVFVVTMIIGFLATWIPSQRAKRINVAQVLRQE